MSNSPRIDDLRRLIQKDPASIAFAQLAEELRRSGALQEAVDTCRAGLGIHPSYLSARVTLGRALLELNQLEAAEAELGRVLTNAGDNLAALRGLGEISSRRGTAGEALKYYQTALALAPNDPDLEALVANLSGALEPEPAITVREEATLPPTPVVQVPALVAEAPADAVSCVPTTPGSLDPARDHAARLVAALQTWLDAIDVSRTDRRA
jgi:tetratricopeptide (TPR) repeat protein